MSKTFKVRIGCDEDRYINADNSSSHFVEREIEIKYLQLIEDIFYRLDFMRQCTKGDKSNT